MIRSEDDCCRALAVLQRRDQRGKLLVDIADRPAIGAARPKDGLQRDVGPVEAVLRQKAKTVGIIVFRRGHVDLRRWYVAIFIAIPMVLPAQIGIVRVRVGHLKEEGPAVTAPRAVEDFLHRLMRDIIVIIELDAAGADTGIGQNARVRGPVKPVLRPVRRPGEVARIDI